MYRKNHLNLIEIQLRGNYLPLVGPCRATRRENALSKQSSPVLREVGRLSKAQRCARAQFLHHLHITYRQELYVPG